VEILENKNSLYFVHNTMAKMIKIQNPVTFDESIAHCEVHAHQPFASSTFKNNDEIRIAVQNQDLCVLPSKSALHIYGRITKGDNTPVAATTELVNMAVCHMFGGMRYELNGCEIDQNMNVGITSVMKGYLSFTPGQRHLLENTGWLGDDDTLTNGNGYFDVVIPLNFLLGFAEDYNRIIVNAKHELILTRSNNDSNAIIQTATENVKISLNKIEWLLPYIKLAGDTKIKMLNYIAKDPAISMSFRSWEMYEYPMLPRTTRHVWVIKTSTQLEKPRHVILGFQTARRNDAEKNASEFDHCMIRDVKLFLNSQCYPYGNLNLDIANNQYAILYDMYTNFQSSYYDKEPEPLLSKNRFLTKAPLIVIDCSKQNESLKSGPVDIRLEFEASVEFPANTAAYCMILHDRIVEYNPISNTVRKLV
jgi:hypothetical protein